MTIKIFIASILLFTLFNLVSLSSAQAQVSRCDCSEKVGECTATIELKNWWFDIRSSTRQCSQVFFYTDETPRMTLVVDGREREKWYGPTEFPALSVDKCFVCKDTEYGEEGSEERLGKTDDDSYEASIADILMGTWSVLIKASPPPADAGPFTKCPVNRIDGSLDIHTQEGPNSFSGTANLTAHAAPGRSEEACAGFPLSTGGPINVEVNGKQVTIDPPIWDGPLTLNQHRMTDSTSSQFGTGTISLTKR